MQKHLKTEYCTSERTVASISGDWITAKTRHFPASNLMHNLE